MFKPLPTSHDHAAAQVHDSSAHAAQAVADALGAAHDAEVSRRRGLILMAPPSLPLPGMNMALAVLEDEAVIR
jgi:hypothetical protein